MSSKNIVGRNIRRIRIAKGMTVHQLAAALPPSAILGAGELAEIEVGTEKAYDYEVLGIADALGVSVDSLFDTPQRKLPKTPK